MSKFVRRPSAPPQKPKTASVPRLWPGETVVCIASGPSLTLDDVNYVRGRAKVIVVNTSVNLAPWADVLYACDDRWWKWAYRFQKQYPGVHQFTGLKFAITAQSARFPGVKVIGRSGIDGLSMDPRSLRTGSNSGYQAINLAVLMGATRIVLLGYDMQTGHHGRQHWHPDHPMKMVSPYSSFRRYYETLVEPLKAAGVDVINCSRDTALKCFPRQALQDVFPPLAAQEVA